MNNIICKQDAMDFSDGILHLKKSSVIDHTHIVCLHLKKIKFDFDFKIIYNTYYGLWSFVFNPLGI